MLGFDSMTDEKTDICRTACNAIGMAAVLLACGWTMQAGADETQTQFQDRYAEQPFRLSGDDGPGISKHRVDGYTKINGWQLSDSWYLGKQKGSQSGLALRWQGEHSQFSLSTKGMRVTRRF